MTMANLRQLTENPAAMTVFATMHAAGHTVRFIGGCVRDALLGRAIGDIDLATDATPGQIMTALADYRIIPTGLAHGTVTVVVAGQSFEITTLRHDVQTDGRHAIVAFTHDWAEDARRRDFTINALGLDLSGQVHDYCGGLDDLQEKRLRFIGNPALRITEDYLRILRYFRFAAVLDWVMDERDVTACESQAGHLGRLSRERVQMELYKLLVATGCGRIVATMIERDIFTAIARTTYNVAAFNRLADMENNYALADPFRRLIVLTGHMNVTFFAAFLVLTGTQKRRLEQLAKLNGAAYLPMHEKLYRFGRETFIDQALWNNDEAALKTALAWNKLSFPLTARDVFHLTDGPGPRVGAILRQAEDYWIDREFKPTRDELLTFAAA